MRPSLPTRRCLDLLGWPVRSRNQRLASETFKACILASPGFRGHALHITLAYDADSHLHEVAFVGRAIIGHEIDQMLVDAGVMISRLIQGRCAMTGVPVMPPSDERLVSFADAADREHRFTLRILRGEAGLPVGFRFDPIGEPTGISKVLAAAAEALNRIIAGDGPATGRRRGKCDHK